MVEVSLTAFRLREVFKWRGCDGIWVDVVGRFELSIVRVRMESAVRRSISWGLPSVFVARGEYHIYELDCHYLRGSWSCTSLGGLQSPLEER